MPLLVNSSVGSLAGTSEDEGTIVCPRAAKNSRKRLRMSAVFMGRVVRETRRLIKSLHFTALRLSTGGPGRLIVRRRPQQLEDRGQREAPSWQEADLPRLLAIVRRGFAELAPPERDERGGIVDLPSGQRFGRRLSGHALGLDLMRDRTLAVRAALLVHDGLGEACVAEVTLLFERVQHRIDFFGADGHRSTGGEELAAQLRARIFAARQIADGARLQRLRGPGCPVRVVGHVTAGRGESRRRAGVCCWCYSSMN